MNQSAYTPFKTIPISKRIYDYSTSIKRYDNLWVVPTYNVGEIWEWYGGGEQGQFEVIQVLSENQILFKVHAHEVIGYRNESYQIKEYFYLGNRAGEDGYVSFGTPTLRKRIK